MKIGIYNTNTVDPVSTECSSVFLADRLGRRHDVEILHHATAPDIRPLSDGEQKSQHFRLVEITPPPRFVTHPGEPTLSCQRLRDWSGALTEKYDLFINYTDYWPLFSAAARGVLVVQHPRQWMPSNYQWLWRDHLQTYQLKMTSSYFAQRWLQKLWDVEAEVVLPPFHAIGPTIHAKEDVILVSGSALTEQIDLDAAIDELGSRLPGWSIIRMEKESAISPVEISDRGVKSHQADDLQRASIYINGAGYLQDYATYLPEGVPLTELLKAMDTGCVPLVTNTGSFPEIIRHNESGYFWDNPSQLVQQVEWLVKDRPLRLRIGTAAHNRSRVFAAERHANDFLGCLENSLGIRVRRSMSPITAWQRMVSSASKLIRTG